MPFGQDYQKEVQDVNEGRSKAEASTSGITTDQASTGQRLDRVDERGSREGIRGLVNFAAETVSGINVKQQREDFQKAYATSVEDAQGELDRTNEEESGWMSTVFGKSATQRGFHKRVLQNETDNFQLQHLKGLKRDATLYKNPADYHKNVIAPALKNALSKQSDSGMRSDIVSNFSKVASGLGRQFVTERVAYEQVLNRKATLKGVTNKINVYRTALESGSVVDSKRLYKELKSEFTVPKNGMAKIAHQDTVVNAILRDIGQGHPEGIQLLEELQKNGDMELDVENQDKINAAKEVYIRDQGMGLSQKTFELESLINTQAQNFEEVLQAAQSKYGNNINVNAYREKYEARRIDVAAEAAQTELDISSLINGIAVPDKGRATKAATAIQSRVGSALVQNQRQALLANQQAQGVPEEEWVNIYAGITEEEQLNAIIDNPEAIVNTWAGSQTPMPVVTQSQVRLAGILNQEKHTDSDAIEIERLLTFNDTLEARDPYLFAKQSPSKTEQARTSALSWLITKAKQHPRQAIQTLRNYAKRPEYKWDFENDELGETADELLDEAEKGLGFTFTDAKNRDDVLWQAQNELNTAIKIYKDPEVAKAVASKAMLRNSARVGRQFVFGGAKVDRQSILPTDHYNKLLAGEPRHLDRKEAAGFPRNIDLHDPRITITPYPNGGGMTYSMDSPVDQRYIFLDVDSAKRMADIPIIKKDTFVEEIFEESVLENLKPIE